MAAGRGALVPDFRLAPEHPFPAALDDALAAYRWLAGQRGDASEVVLAGDSSGAGLALAVLLSLKAEGEALARDARHAGVDVRVERYAADTHVFHMFWSFLPEAADAVGQVGGFVSSLLRAAPAAAGDHTANLPSASPRPRPSPRQI